MNLNRTLVAPLSSAIIALMVAGGIVVGIDQIQNDLAKGEVELKGQGVVEVSIGGDPWVRAARGRTLRPGDRVQVKLGTANLKLESGTAALRPGSVLLIPEDAVIDLVLQEGELLVQSGDKGMEVEGGVALASINGAAKLRRSESLAVGVYKGNVELIKGTARRGISQYRQAAAAGTGVLPDEVDPLTLSYHDSWDLQMLPDVLALDEKLAAFGQDFEASIPAGRDKDAQLFSQVLPDLPAGPLSGVLAGNRAAGENVIGLALVALDSGDFDSRVKNIFGFRSRGARWGLVAADRNLNPNPVLGSVEQALGRLETALGLPGATAGDGNGRGPGGGRSQIGGSVLPSTGDGTGNGPSGSGPAGGPAGAPNGTPTTPGAPGTPGTPGTPPSTPPPGQDPKRVDLPPVGLGLDPLLEPVVNPLENLLSGLLDGLLGPSQGTTTIAPASATPSPTPTTTPTTAAPAPTTTTTTSLVGGLVGGLTTTVGGLLK